jgi:fibronectin-binding autotransporter adhesin
MQKTITRRSLRFGVAVAALVILPAATAPRAMAQNDYVWTGANSQPGIINDPTHWSNPYNWLPAAFIRSDPSTILDFNNTPSGVAVNDLGTFVLNGMTFFSSTNGCTISGNPLNFQGGSSSFIESESSLVLSITVANNLTVNASAPFNLFGAGLAVNLSGAISGTGSLNVNEGTSAILSNTGNSYSGGTIIRGGTLSTGATGALPTGRDVTVQAGSLNLNSTAQSIGGLTLSDPTATITSAAPAVHINSFGTLTLGGNVTYNPSSAAPGANISGGTLSLGGATRTFNIPFRGESPYDLVIDAAISDNAGGLTKTGNGSLALIQRNAYPGPTTLNSGDLFLGAVNAVQSAVVVNGGHLYLAPDSTAQGITAGSYNQSFGSLAGTNDSVLDLGAATLTVGTDNTSTSYAGVLTGDVGCTLVKVGTGTLTLSQSTAIGIYNITISGGALAVVIDGKLGYAGVGSNMLAVNPAGTLRYTGSTSTSRTFDLNGGTLEAAAGVTLTLNRATVNGGFLRGAGTFSLTGGTALFGNTTFNSTILAVAGAASATSFTNGGTLTIAAGQTFTWNGGTNASSGTITTSGAANFSDFTNNGQISIRAGGGIYNSVSNLVLGGGSRTTIDTSGLLSTAAGTTIELNGGLLVNNGTIAGTIDVNYGSLAKGTGAYGVINMNQGGMFAPGNSPGIVTAAAVNFDNTPLSSGAPILQIELAGTTPGSQYDQLHVTGQLSLGGTLSVVLGFSPSAGNSFDILDWGSLAGTFAALQLPTLASGRAWNTSQLYTTGVLSVVASAGIAGDYNNNGIVDAADYVVWRSSLGSTTNLAADGNRNGVIDSGDLSVWRANFGQTGGSSANIETTPVPEPAAISIYGLMLVGLFGMRRFGCAKDACLFVFCRPQ